MMPGETILVLTGQLTAISRLFYDHFFIAAINGTLNVVTENLALTISDRKLHQLSQVSGVALAGIHKVDQFSYASKYLTIKVKHV